VFFVYFCFIGGLLLFTNRTDVFAFEANFIFT